VNTADSPALDPQDTPEMACATCGMGLALSIRGDRTEFIHPDLHTLHGQAAVTATAWIRGVHRRFQRARMGPAARL